MYGERMLGRALRRRSRRASGLATVESVAPASSGACGQTWERDAMGHVRVQPLGALRRGGAGSENCSLF